MRYEASTLFTVLLKQWTGGQVACNMAANISTNRKFPKFTNEMSKSKVEAFPLNEI